VGNNGSAKAYAIAAKRRENVSTVKVGAFFASCSKFEHDAVGFDIAGEIIITHDASGGENIESQK